MVMGHTLGRPSEVTRVIYSFHMPLFFFLSGYLWTDRNIEGGLKAFVARKFRSLIVPYMKIAAVCWLTYVIITPPMLTDFNFDDYIERNIKCLIGVVCSIGTVEYLPNCSPIWYLTSLFWANIFFFGVRRYRIHPVFILVILGLGWLLTMPKHVIWNIGSATVGCAFMWIGYMVKTGAIKINKAGQALMAALLIAIIAIWGLPFVNMDGHHYSNYILFLVVATLECLLLITIARDYMQGAAERAHGVISFIAANSIAIFGYNYAANSVVGIVNHFVEPHWLVNYVIALFSLYVFIVLIKRMRIERLFV